MAQHISVRVPWKDNGYSGNVCNKPCFNNACLRLGSIAKNRDDELEENLKGCPIKGHEAEIPCLSEGACFMSASEHRKTTVHPYKKGNEKTHGHFLETELVYPPFSLPARPFAWTMRERNTAGRKQKICDLAAKYGIDYKEEKEPVLGFETNWVQDADNQREIFRVFYQDVKVNESLVIPYAKQVPFIDDSKRVVMGIGFVTSVKEPPEHNHTDEGKLRSILWETMLGHSIRDDRKNGFLMPYREMMDYAEKHPEFDMRSITVFAEDDYFDEFSYATEHLSYDAVISVLLQTIKALEIIRECGISGNWDECIAWTKKRLEEVWRDRGPFPGLDSMLSAVGFRCGAAMSNEIKKKNVNAADYEKVLDEAVASPEKYFPEIICRNIKRTEQDAFKALAPERKQLFWLLARMSLTDEQADIIYNTEKRKSYGIDCTDSEIIENPYVLYEKTRRCAQGCCIPVKKVDMAVFPPKETRMLNPLQAPSALDSENDRRRMRAYMIYVLERHALEGHTVYPAASLIEEINNQPIEPECHATGDIINGMAPFLEEELCPEVCSNGEKAYQLIRIFEFDDVIRKSVDKRLNGSRHEIKEDWRRIVDQAFEGQPSSKFEEDARKEKAAILKELAESRLSVLIGGAGTGKTTLLALLCKSPKIRDGGVLLLAPTGKARVRMSQAMNQQGVPSTAKTVAQFLFESERFDVNLMDYHLSDVKASNVPATVIIDEASMLTEEMFGALLQALKSAQRIIFVGDPNQLPPIGAGRPFVDLVRRLNKDIPEFPKVGRGFGQLTVTMRQLSEDGSPRGDTELSKWYTGNTENLDEDIFIGLAKGSLGKHVSFKTWTTPEELEERIFETICEETEMQDTDDKEGFNKSLGGHIENGWMNFGGSKHQIERLEDWQILSAYRNDAVIGTATINRYIQGKYRSQKSMKLANCSIRSTRNILGNDGIIYGDKVINVKNQRIKGYSVEKNKPEDGYVANGEVGIVENVGVKPNLHQIVFSSQPDMNYRWEAKVSDEGASDLELAYALTVHKAQGSEFGKVILVLGEPCRMLSKELLYTAITRQKDKLIILYNEKAWKLKEYSSFAYSEVARRFTCLFEKPDIVGYKKRYYENKLIHKTVKGEMVRSKSEVIIANMLHDAGIEYEYERELDLKEDGTYIPDFTIDDAESGVSIYWEHCGLPGDPGYNIRWEKKKAVYEKHGIIEGENLIVTKDALDGSIDSAGIKAVLDKYF